MQEQAAPPRFRGEYPHTLMIRNDYLPMDNFVRQALKEACDKKLLKRNPRNHVGNFPKLVLRVEDPQIQKLAGPNLEKFDAIDCKDIDCTCEDKPRYAQLFKSTEADRDSILYNNCKRTIFAAAKRQMKSAPVPDLAVARDFLSFAKRKIDELVGDELRSFGYSYSQWYNHLTHAKQLRMDKVHEFVHGTDPLQAHYTPYWRELPARERNEFAKLFHYEAICKPEIQSTDGKPRMVCAIPDLIKYVMGPVCWALEELFAKRIPTYCGGQNLQQMADKINHYIDEGFEIVAEGDGSAFDNTQDVLLKEVDRYIYELVAEKVHHVPKELFLYVANMYYKVMDVIMTNNKKKVVIMSYAVLGTVFSGDCDTTLMNTLRMGLYNWYTNEKGGMKIKREFVCFSKGDDFTVMYNILVDIEKVKKLYLTYWLGKPKPNGPIYDGCDERVYGLGQILKFIEFGRPHTIKFCSLRAWYIDHATQHIYLTRDPSKFTTLSKYSRKILHMTTVAGRAYLRDQADAMRVIAPGIHYFQAMAMAYDHLADTFCGMRGSTKCRQKVDRRRTLPLEVSEWNGYDYTPREVDIKIDGQYWETMQRYWYVNDTELTPDQLSLVNMQIDAEFADRPISVLLGP